MTRYVYERRDTTIIGRREATSWRRSDPPKPLADLLDFYCLNDAIIHSVVLTEPGTDSCVEWRVVQADLPKVGDKVTIDNIGELPDGTVIAGHGLEPWHRKNGRWFSASASSGMVQSDLAVISMNQVLDLIVLRMGMR